MDIVLVIGFNFVDITRKMNYIPRRKDLITFKENQYKVISVDFDFDDDKIYITVE